MPLTPEQAKLFTPVTKEMLREMLKIPEGVVVDRLEPWFTPVKPLNWPPPRKDLPVGWAKGEGDAD